jgi:hypothetical protein
MSLPPEAAALVAAADDWCRWNEETRFAVGATLLCARVTVAGAPPQSFAPQYTAAAWPSNCTAQALRLPA